MGDSDDDYNSATNQSSSAANLSLGGGGGFNASNTANGNLNNNIKKNRDKFYRERDESTSNNNNTNNNSYNNNGNSNYNNNGKSGVGENRRDWNNDRNRSSSNDWKGRNNMGMSGGNNYNPGGGGGYQQRNNPGGNAGSSDYPRKYSHNQNSPGHHSGAGGNYDSSPPPNKRNKKEWDSHMDQVYGTSSTYHSRMPQQHQHQQSHQSDYSKSQNEPEYPTQPPFLSFKLFLQRQDDNISDEDAIKKYNEYKIDFKKTQINNFFLEHKEEEWFKTRYHPDENYKRRSEQNQFVLNRLETFMDMWTGGWLNDVSVECDKTKELIRFLDAFVIKLEGGTEEDVKEQLDGIISSAPPSSKLSKETREENNTIKKDNDSEDNPNLESSEAKIETEESKDDSDLNKTDATNGSIKKTNGEPGAAIASKRKPAEDSGSESGAYTDSDSDDANQENGSKKKSKSHHHHHSSGSKKKEQQQQQQTHQKQFHRTSSIFMRNLAPSVTKQDLEQLCKTMSGFKRVALSDPAPERGFFRRGWLTFEFHVDVKKICWSLQNIKIKECNPGAIVNRELSNRIRPIANLVSHHKSVVKNNIKLAMKIVQNMDKKWNLWQSDDLNNASGETTTAQTDSVPGSDAKDDSKKPTGGEETQQQQNQTDIENAKLEEEAFGKLKQTASLYLTHKFNGVNPLLENITDYLVDEINAEEEELLGDGSTAQQNNSSSKSNSFDIEIDRNYNKALDKLVLYLRLVHSIDFYNSIEYQQEDLMPNRCGIMFVRPALPVNAASASLKITNQEINTYIQQFEAKMKPYVEFKEKIEVDMAKKLGIKEMKEEIEKFIKTNTTELAPDRWLCPLSGKRFKGPEFIRKHLFYKHMDKINEVKKEVDYFNNYVFDPKRPQLPEHPMTRSSGSTLTTSSSTTSSTSSNLLPSSNPSTLSSSTTTTSLSSSQMHQTFSSSNQMINPNTMPGLLVSPQMIQNQMQYQMRGGWQQGGSVSGQYMPDMMQQQQQYGSFNPSMGGSTGMGGFHSQGFKKPGYGPGNYNQNNFRRGGNTGGREMIQYKDLDAPEDA